MTVPDFEDQVPTSRASVVVSWALAARTTVATTISKDHANDGAMMAIVRMCVRGVWVWVSKSLVGWNKNISA